MSREKCQDQAGLLFWMHFMHLMHQLQMIAALIHYLQLCLSCQREQRRQENSIAARQIFFSRHGRKKTRTEKKKKKKRKRRTIVLVWCSHRVPGEPCVRLSVWERGAAFQMYSLLPNSPPGWGRQTKPYFPTFCQENLRTHTTVIHFLLIHLPLIVD